MFCGVLSLHHQIGKTVKLKIPYGVYEELCREIRRKPSTHGILYDTFYEIFMEGLTMVRERDGGLTKFVDEVYENKERYMRAKRKQLQLKGVGDGGIPS
jgi:hypothetical protein